MKLVMIGMFTFFTASASAQLKCNYRMEEMKAPGFHTWYVMKAKETIKFMKCHEMHLDVEFSEKEKYSMYILSDGRLLAVEIDKSSLLYGSKAEYLENAALFEEKYMNRPRHYMHLVEIEPHRFGEYSKYYLSIISDKLGLDMTMLDFSRESIRYIDKKVRSVDTLIRDIWDSPILIGALTYYVGEVFRVLHKDARWEFPVDGEEDVVIPCIVIGNRRVQVAFEIVKELDGGVPFCLEAILP